MVQNDHVTVRPKHAGANINKDLTTYYVIAQIFKQTKRLYKKKPY